MIQRLREIIKPGANVRIISIWWLKRFPNKSQRGWGLSERRSAVKTIAHYSLQIFNMNLKHFWLIYAFSATANSKVMILMPKLHYIGHTLKTSWHCLINGRVAAFRSSMPNIFKYLEMYRQKRCYGVSCIGDANHFTILHLHDLKWLECNWLELWWTNVIINANKSCENPILSRLLQEIGP